MIDEPLGTSAQEVAERLSLTPHPEGGWYRETHRAPGSPRGAMTSILYLLDAGTENRWHRVDALEAWYWHAGGSVEIEMHEPGAPFVQTHLSNQRGHALQAFIPPYAWQRARAGDGGWVLLACVVAPAFSFEGFEMAPSSWTPAMPDPRFGPLLDTAIADLGAESGSVHLLMDDRELHLICASGIPSAVLSIVRRVPIGKGMAGLAVERGGPVTACNIQTDSSGDVRPGAKATGLEGAMVVPIVDDRDGIVGALGVANRAARTFTAEETVRLIDHGRLMAQARLGRRMSE